MKRVVRYLLLVALVLLAHTMGNGDHIFLSIVNGICLGVSYPTWIRILRLDR